MRARWPLPLLVVLGLVGPAATGALGESHEPLEDLAVSVTVAPDPFSPNRDGRRDITTIAVDATPHAEVAVELMDRDDAIRRTWSATADGDGAVVIDWNGRAGGGVVPDGRYRVRATASVAELSTEDTARVTVDTKRPRLTWLGISPEPLVNQDAMRFRYRLRDRSSRVKVTLTLRDVVRRVGRERRNPEPGDRRFRWRTRYPGGGRLFPGPYRARLVGRDQAGNVGSSKPRAWRVHRDVKAKVYRRLQGVGRRMALTFDDCHFSGAWRRILDVLRAHRVKAAFFCPGQQINAYPGLVRRTVRQGHTLAAHGWDHTDLSGRAVSETSRRLSDDARAAWSVARTTTAPYFRPPYGAYDGNTLAGATATSHPRVMMWDVDPLDWRRPGSGVIASRVLQSSRRGSVVLLHTLDQTASALPSIIRGLRDRGLKPVSLPRLFQAAGMR